MKPRVDEYKMAVRRNDVTDEKEKPDAEQEEIAPIDRVEERVEAEMKVIEGRAKESVGQGMQNRELEREGRELQEEGEQELQEQSEQP